MTWSPVRATALILAASRVSCLSCLAMATALISTVHAASAGEPRGAARVAAISAVAPIASVAPVSSISLASAVAPIAPRSSLSSLSWMAGHWRGMADSTRLEEHWSLPAGDCMMGMFRAVRDGHVRAYQFMSLEQDPGGVLLRVKRFEPGLVGKEDKEHSVVFRLERSSMREAVFEYEGPESPKRLTYRRTGHDSLYVRLERVQGGEHGVMNFRFVRFSE